MQPIGMLMREHRLIERILPLLESEMERSTVSKKIDAMFINAAIDFFQTYVDMPHHGKEEDILFKALLHKKLTTKHKAILKQLVYDHRRARQIIRSLNTANQRYLRGDDTALQKIHNKIGQLMILYHQHIETEDKHFFFPTMEYFTRKECDDMLREFIDFDTSTIHKHYTQFIEKQEKKV